MRTYPEILSELLRNRIIAILRVRDAETAERGVRALANGGIRSIEIAMNTPGALDVIRRTSDCRELLVGAGTVLDETTCRLAIMNGAQYVVTPTLNEGVIRCAGRYQKPVVCGCMTPTEMLRAAELGVNMIKIFPASEFSPSSLRAFKGPLPQFLMGPTGGVNLGNLKDWDRNGADFFGIAGEFSTLADAGEFERLTQIAAEYMLEAGKRGE
ncbi:hypothetical protein BHK98_07700 [Hornefia porci]|uniref:2-dehydro-3-deoxyphosphogluconate aldolase n=1 Tax=Hornefia porci TaxID=2652292 RepID=A0A1Q9JII5_9FIRM|nr:hypothetical protein [Hornefia porci]OLR55951.1 hypothetical protein BHK98_07700 [Hornefia porci]